LKAFVISRALLAAKRRDQLLITSEREAAEAEMSSQTYGRFAFPATDSKARWALKPSLKNLNSKFLLTKDTRKDPTCREWLDIIIETQRGEKE